MSKDKKFKLNYRVVGRRDDPSDQFGLDHVDVEWRHDDGFPPDVILKPVGHPPDVTYEEVEVGRREVVKDQLSVPAGTPDSIVMKMLEEKRQTLARALGVEP